MFNPSRYRWTFAVYSAIKKANNAYVRANRSLAAVTKDYVSAPLLGMGGYLVLNAFHIKDVENAPQPRTSFRPRTHSDTAGNALTDDEVRTSFRSIQRALKHLDKAMYTYWNTLAVGVDGAKDQMDTSRRKINDLYATAIATMRPDPYIELLGELDGYSDRERAARMLQIQKLQQEDALFAKLDAEYREYLSRTYQSLMRQPLPLYTRDGFEDKFPLTTSSEHGGAASFGGKFATDALGLPFSSASVEGATAQHTAPSPPPSPHHQHPSSSAHSAGHSTPPTTPQDTKDTQDMIRNRLYEFEQLGYGHLVELYKTQDWDTLMGPIHNLSGEVIIPPSTFLPPHAFDMYKQQHRETLSQVSSLLQAAQQSVVGGPKARVGWNKTSQDARYAIEKGIQDEEIDLQTPFSTWSRDLPTQRANRMSGGMAIPRDLVDTVVEEKVMSLLDRTTGQSRLERYSPFEYYVNQREAKESEAKPTREDYELALHRFIEARPQIDLRSPLSLTTGDRYVLRYPHLDPAYMDIQAGKTGDFYSVEDNVVVTNKLTPELMEPFAPPDVNSRPEAKLNAFTPPEENWNYQQKWIYENYNVLPKLRTSAEYRAADSEARLKLANNRSLFERYDPHYGTLSRAAGVMSGRRLYDPLAEEPPSPWENRTVRFPWVDPETIPTYDGLIMFAEQPSVLSEQAKAKYQAQKRAAEALERLDDHNAKSRYVDFVNEYARTQTEEDPPVPDYHTWRAMHERQLTPQMAERLEGFNEGREYYMYWYGMDLMGEPFEGYDDMVEPNSLDATEEYHDPNTPLPPGSLV